MKRICLLPALGGLACLLFQASCTGGDEAGAVRRLIEKGARLAEKHDVGGLLELTTADFSADPGSRDLAETRSILWMAFRHYREFRILYPRPGIEIAEGGQAASATVYFLIVRKDRSYPELKDLSEDPAGWLEEVGENADLYRLTLDLTRTEGDWLTKRALLEPFRGAGFGEKRP